jgi:calcineurin-like phosphoesterase family protein
LIFIKKYVIIFIEKIKKRKRGNDSMALPGVYDMFNERWCKQTVWIYSDPHFGDKELAAGMPKRPSDEEQVKRINARVGRKDTLIILGDVGDVEFAKQLRGYKVLICGNHDAGKTNYAEVFDEIYTGALIIGEKLILSHEPVDIPWLFNIHGHDHSGKAGRKNHLNVCSDVIDYDPINLNQIMKTGLLSRTESIHRLTIDEATERKKKRGGKKIAKTASKISS